MSAAEAAAAYVREVVWGAVLRAAANAGRTSLETDILNVSVGVERWCSRRVVSSVAGSRDSGSVWSDSSYD